MRTPNASPASLDRLAIGLSGLCAIHCALTPIAVILFPVLSAVLGSDARFHALLLVPIVPSSMLALALGCRRHRDARVLRLGGAGLGLLAGTVALGHVEYVERVVTLGGTALVVAAHARNFRLCCSDRCGDPPSIRVTISSPRPARGRGRAARHGRARRRCRP